MERTSTDKKKAARFIGRLFNLIVRLVIQQR